MNDGGHGFGPGGCITPAWNLTTSFTSPPIPLRDLFAVIALARLPLRDYEIDEAAIEAYEIADAMLAARDKKAPDVTVVNLKDQIESIIPVKEVFTAPEVQRYLKSKNPHRASRLTRVTTRRYLSELVDSGMIEVVRNGKGGRATRYRKKNPDSA